MTHLAAKRILPRQQLRRLGLFLDKRLGGAGAEIGNGGLDLASLAGQVGAPRIGGKPCQLCGAGFLLVARPCRQQRGARFMAGLDKWLQQGDFLSDKRCLP